MGVLSYKEIKSRNNNLNISTVHIPESSAFFARFDCLHAGANYSETNIRVHFFLDPKKSSIIWRDVKKVYFSADARDFYWYNYDEYRLTRKQYFENALKKKSQEKVKRADLAAKARAAKLSGGGGGGNETDTTTTKRCDTRPEASPRKKKKLSL